MPQNDDHAAALEAMASGEHTDAAQQAAEMETSHADADADADNPAIALADSDEQNDATAAAPVGGNRGDGPPSERARQKKIRQAQAKATGTQIKKTMVPLLLVSGVILLLLGGLTSIMRASGDVTEADGSNTVLLLTVAAFVLAPILIIGGWLLHADVKKSER
ncbi:MAG: hypothetical protein ACOCZU_02275 [Planctomycetota bacterium]